MAEKREANYDLLRVLAMIAVIVTHVSGTWFSGLWEFAAAGMDTWEMMHPFASPLFYTLSRFAVPSFVMLSGAFLLDRPQNADYRSFYSRTFRKVGIPALLFSAFYALYSIPSCIWGDNPGWESVKALLLRVLRGEPFPHMWYLYMMAGVYILTPVVIRFRGSVSRKTYARAAWVFLLLAGISAWTTSGRILDWSLGYSFEFLGYFMIGDVLRQSLQKKSFWRGILMILAGLIVETVLAWYIYQINYVTVTDLYAMRVGMLDYMGLPVMAASVLIFGGFSLLQIRENRLLQFLSRRSYYVYLIHACVYDLIKKGFRLKTHLRSYIFTRLDGLWAIPFFTVIVLLISVLLAGLCLRYERRRPLLSSAGKHQQSGKVSDP